MVASGILKCGQCFKIIPYDEFVVNWGSCDACFDENYREYLLEPRTIARDAVHEQGIGE